MCWLSGQRFLVAAFKRQSCEATNRNAIQAERDPVVSCRWTVKPFPTDPKVDGELVQRRFTLLFGEICDAYP